jgi:hypothetical protein
MNGTALSKRSLGRSAPGRNQSNLEVIVVSHTGSVFKQIRKRNAWRRTTNCMENSGGCLPSTSTPFLEETVSISDSSHKRQSIESLTDTGGTTGNRKDYAQQLFSGYSADAPTLKMTLGSLVDFTYSQGQFSVG